MSPGTWERAFAYGRAVVDGVGRDSAEVLNSFAWLLVDPDQKPKLEKTDLELALKAATRASELTKNEDPGILDTLACVHFARGEVEKAIEVQERAIEQLDPSVDATPYKQRLERFQKALQN